MTPRLFSPRPDLCRLAQCPQSNRKTPTTTIHLLASILLVLVISGCATQSVQHKNVESVVPNPAQTTPMDIGKTFKQIDFALPSDPNLIRKLPEKNRYAGVSREAIPDLISRLQVGFAMPNLNSVQVDHFIDQYAKQAALERTLVRAQYFLHDILTELELRNMPTELALLPIVESSFSTKAHSSASAVGVWQFISTTGWRFGLRQNAWLDERQYTPKATVAALEYLKWLYGQFGNWHLALAGYNCGEACVQRALKNVSVPFSTLTYDDLPIPRETQQYAPRLQALKEIFLEPEKYHIKLPVIPNRADIGVVKAGVPMSNAMAAKLADISVDEFTFLNAHLKQAIYHPNLESSLLLPIESVATFRDNLATYEALGDTWLVHQAKPLDSLALIAKEYGGDLRALEEANPQWRSKTNPRAMVVVPLENGEGEKARLAASKDKNLQALPPIAMKTANKGKTRPRFMLKKRQVATQKSKNILAKKKSAIKEKYVAPKPLSAEALRKNLTQKKAALIKNKTVKSKNASPTSTKKSVKPVKKSSKP